MEKYRLKRNINEILEKEKNIIIKESTSKPKANQSRTKLLKREEEIKKNNEFPKIIRKINKDKDQTKSKLNLKTFQSNTNSKNNINKEYLAIKNSLQEIHPNEIETLLFLSQEIHINNSYIMLFLKYIYEYDSHIQKIYISKEIESIKNILSLVNKIKKENTLINKSYSILLEIDHYIVSKLKVIPEDMNNVNASYIVNKLKIDDSIISELKLSYSNYLSYSYIVLKYINEFRMLSSFDFMNNKYNIEKFKSMVDINIVMSLFNNINNIKKMKIFIFLNEEKFNYDDYYNSLYQLLKDRIYFDLLAKSTIQTELVKNKIRINKISKDLLKVSNSSNSMITNLSFIKDNQNINKNVNSYINNDDSILKNKLKKRLNNNKIEIFENADFSISESVIKTNQERVDSNFHNMNNFENYKEDIQKIESNQEIYDDIDNNDDYTKIENIENIDETNKSHTNISEHIDQVSVENVEIIKKDFSFEFYQDDINKINEIYKDFRYKAPINQLRTFDILDHIKNYDKGIYPKIILVKSQLINEGLIIISYEEDKITSSQLIKFELVLIINENDYKTILTQAIQYIQSHLNSQKFIIELNYFVESTDKNQSSLSKIDPFLKSNFEELGFKWKSVINRENKRKIKYLLKLDENEELIDYLSIDYKYIINIHNKEEVIDSDMLSKIFHYYILQYQYQYHNDNIVIDNDYYYEINKFIYKHMIYEICWNKKFSLNHQLEFNNIDSFKKAARMINSFMSISSDDVVKYLSELSIIQNSETSQQLLSEKLMISNPFLLKSKFDIKFSSMRSLIIGNNIYNKLSISKIEIFSYKESLFYYIKNNENDENTILISQLDDDLKILFNNKEKYYNFRLIQKELVHIKTLFNISLILPCFNMDFLYFTSFNEDNDCRIELLSKKPVEKYVITQSLYKSNIRFDPDRYYNHGFINSDDNDTIQINDTFLLVCINDLALEIDDDVIVLEVISKECFYILNK